MNHGGPETATCGVAWSGHPMLPLLLDEDIVINVSIIVFKDMQYSSCVGLTCIVLSVKGMMVARNLYVIGAGPDCGKTVITLGLMELLSSRLDNIGFFRPLVNVRPGSKETDRDIDLILSHFDLDIPRGKTFGYTNAVANTMSSLGKTDELIEGIINKFQKMADSCSVVLCEGVDTGHLSNISEFELDATLCKNLGCFVVVAIDAFEKHSDDIFGTIERISESLRDRSCDVIAFFINRTSEQQEEVLLSAIRLHERLNHSIFHFLPNDSALRRPTLNHIVEEFEAEVLAGKSHLNRHVHDIIIGASHVDNLIRQIGHGILVVTPGDRIDILLGALASVHSRNLGSISGIVLTDAITPDGAVKDLIEGMDDIVPILSLKEDLSEVIVRLKGMHATISPQDKRNIHSALALFDRHIDSSDLTNKVINAKAARTTPKMFEHHLLQRARQERCHIVLPEGEDERILRAADILTRREVARITVLGRQEAIEKKLSILGFRLPGVEIVDPIESDKTQAYGRTFYELRKHKGMTLEQARDSVIDATYFGTMMVAQKDADGMVSGALHSTANTIRPALQIIKTDSNSPIISSVFFMGLKDRVLVYGDCAVNPDPSPEELAQIAIASALTAHKFGIEPIVAMLSYSSGQSGTGVNVDKVRKATEIATELAKESYPELLIDGPMQYDAAVDPSVAAQKMPESSVAGKATVLIFPDLNTGNNTYKAVQRSANATAVGPVLQGLQRPVNDLSRGCSVHDIVTMVAITAIQAISGENAD